jgi:hypothetical protein
MANPAIHRTCAKSRAGPVILNVRHSIRRKLNERMEHLALDDFLFFLTVFVVRFGA